MLFLQKWISMDNKTTITYKMNLINNYINSSRNNNKLAKQTENYRLRRETMTLILSSQGRCDACLSLSHESQSLCKLSPNFQHLSEHCIEIWPPQWLLALCLCLH